MKQKKFDKNWIVILIAIALLTLISVSTKYYGSSDIGDYTDTAKFFAGKLAAKLRTSHPISYGLIHSPLLKLFDTFLFLKLSSVLFLSLLIISTYYISNKNKKTLLLIITAPVIWFMAPYISPTPLAALLFLWSYYFIKKYNEQGKIKHLLYSGFLIGVSWIFWEAIIYFAFAMVICFLLNKKMLHSIYFILTLIIGVFPKLLIDYVFFGFPFYSILKHFLSVIAFSFYGSIYGQTEERGFFQFLPTLLLIPIYTIILFTKKNIKKYKNQIFFILFSLFMIWLASSLIRYVFIIIPIIILLLGEILTERQFKIQLVFFLVLTLLVVNPYIIQIKYETNAYEYPLIITKITNLEIKEIFTSQLIQQDLRELGKDFPNQTFIVGNQPDDYQRLAHFYWGSDIKEFVSIQDYELYLKNDITIFSKSICSKSKSWNRRDICVSASLEKPFSDNTDYRSIKYALSTEENLNSENFKLVKKYQKISLFEKT